MNINRAKQIESLFLSFYNARQRIISQEKFSHPEVDITFSQWVALDIVEKNKKCSIDEISKALHISSSAATQLIDCLQKKKFVIRKVGLEDRRISSIELSSKTKKLFNSMKRKKAAHMKKLFSCFTDSELKTFVTLIKKITLNVYN
ncbi:MAG: MarR family transcriptional regulator [Candidatus Staskawiczbacteria bacterium]|jgi:DNA-binding MarR family transcriptional regulator